MSKKKLKIIITGSSGYIGSYLVKKLKKNFSITGIDYKYPSFNPIGYKFIKKNLLNLNEFELKKILKKKDVLIHLAAIKHNNKKSKKFLIKLNKKFTKKLFYLAKDSSIKKIIFSSSLYVYGVKNINNFKINNERHKCLPNTLYGKSKLYGENILKKLSKNKNLSYYNLRLFFVYGYKPFKKSLYPSFINKTFDRLYSEKGPIIYNDGNQILDYVHIKDVLKIILKCIKTKKKNITLNVCSGSQISIKNIAIEIMKIFKRKDLKIIYGKKDKTKNTVRIGSPYLVKRIFNLNKLLTIKKGLKKLSYSYGR